MIQFISRPVKYLQGEITVPGDKSISHRAVIFGSLAKGVTHVGGFLSGEDCLATIAAFRAMGVHIEENGDQVTLEGVGKFGLKAPQEAIDCGNSGTSIRLLSGVLAAQSFDSVLTGDESLLKRPMERVRKPLTLMGADIETTAGRPPIHIRGDRVLHGLNYDMPEASAQVKSCILLAGLYAEGSTSVSEPGVTRDHTERMLSLFSYPIKREVNRVTIEGNHELKAVSIRIPGDISSAAFFMVAASIIPHSKILIRHVGINPTRTGVVHILEKMGASIHFVNENHDGEEPIADLLIKTADLKGITIPLEWVPLAIDEFPVLFVAAACAKGETILRGAKELRSKESDRIAVMAEGLKRLGIHVQVFDDGISIKGGSLTGGEVESHGDHRIAMAFAIAGAIASEPVIIKDCKNVATSFPTFVSTANKLNLAVEELPQ